MKNCNIAILPSLTFGLEHLLQLRLDGIDAPDDTNTGQTFSGLQMSMGKGNVTYANYYGPYA